jgi:hypothetical protein
MFGAKGPIPESAGRYSLSSRPEGKRNSSAPPKGPIVAFGITIPGPARVPKEASEPTGEQHPRTKSTPPPPGGFATRISPPPPSPQAPSDWRGSTITGVGTPVTGALGDALKRDLKSTLALGSANFREDSSPRTTRGTPPPPANGPVWNGSSASPSVTPPPAQVSQSEAVRARRISIPDTDAPPKVTEANTAPEEAAPPRTHRATVPPAPDRPRQKRDPNQIQVEALRPTIPINTTVPQAMLPVCDELGEACAAESEVTVFFGPRTYHREVALTALAVARRMGKVMPGEVVVVETDFETPSIASSLGLVVPAGRGFSEQLHRRAWQNAGGPWALATAGLGFDILLEGRIRTPGLLWSQGFAEAIRTLSEAYRIVLLIAPGRLTSVDQRALGEVVHSAYAIGPDERAVDRAGAQTPGLIGKLKRAVALSGDAAPKEVSKR